MTTPSGTLFVRRYGGNEPAVVALHGFSLTGASFEPVAAHLPQAVLAPDLPGHGRTTVTPVTMAAAAESIADLIRSSPGPAPLLGYSQGGRLALHVALVHPALVSHLVLVSTSPGIADPAARADRRRADGALADRLEADGLDRFLDDWLADPRLGGGTDPEADRRLRRANTPAGLAAALRGMGQGSHDHLGLRLGELEMPGLAVAGALDPAAVDHALAIAELAPRARAEILSWTGHNIVRDRPRALAAQVADFLTS